MSDLPTLAHRPGAVQRSGDAPGAGFAVAQRSAIDGLIDHARNYAESVHRAGLPKVPTKRLAVVTCMDARINVATLLGLGDADAHVIRNAGAVISDGELRALAMSQRLLHTTEIAVVLHTDCGARAVRDEDFRAALAAETGVSPSWGPVAVGEVEDDVRANVRRILADPFIPHKQHVRGFVFDVETGELLEVR